MSAVHIDAERDHPYRIGRNQQRVCLERDAQGGRRHSITFTITDAYRVANALVDMAEQIEQDN